MVTAEIATALPALALVLVAAIWAVLFAASQLRCVDAAREAARAVARGEEPAVVRQVAQEVAPEGATVDVEQVDGTVRVRVSADVSMPGPVGDAVPAPTAHGEAVAWAEPE